MTQEKIDFAALAGDLLGRARELVAAWLPNGKLRGHEYLVGNLAGEAGESLAINVDTGKWCDFATGEKGGDLISLYAAIHRIGQAKAAQELGAGRSAATRSTPRGSDAKNATRGSERVKPWNVVLPVPPDAPAPPTFKAFELEPKKWTRLKPVGSWEYHDAAGQLLGFVYRFNLPDGKKEVVPLVYGQEADGTKRKWIWKSLPAPRPLYGLPELAARPQAPVLVVEGEKPADAARKLMPAYVVVTWPGGCKAVDQTDFSPLFGRKVLLWPDADNSETYPAGHPRAGQVKDYREQPGPAAMLKIAAKLHGKCPELRLVDVRDVKTDGWDIADAAAAGWDRKRLLAFARERVKPYEPAAVVDLAAKRRDREGAPPMNQYGIWERLELELTDRGAPIANLSNVLKVFERHSELEGLLHYDEFYDRYFHRDGREWEEVDELKLCTWMQRECRFRTVSPLLVHQAVTIAARWRVTNAPRDWMDTLRWDGIPRIEHFMTDALGAPGTDYERAASRNFWVGMAARTYDPGTRLRNVVLLYGKQNTGKSSALSIIGGPWYAEVHESVMNKDFFLAIQGKLLIEISELNAFSRAEVERIKGVISAPIDRFRAPYARVTQDYPRRCIFTGTTNNRTPLTDPTGNTRFWPIETGEIRLDLVRDQREQLFAEAVAVFKSGTTWWEMPEAPTAQMQERFRQYDAWESVVAEHLIGREEITMQEVLTEALKIDIGRQDMAAMRRAAAALRMCGWEQKIEMRSGKTRRYWGPIEV